MAADTHPAPSLPRPPHRWPSGCCSLVPRPRRRVFRAAGSSKSAGDCPTATAPRSPLCPAPLLLPSSIPSLASPLCPRVPTPLSRSAQAPASAACRMPTRTTLVFIKHLRDQISCNYRTREPRGAFCSGHTPRVAAAGCSESSSAVREQPRALHLCFPGAERSRCQRLGIDGGKHRTQSINLPWL